MMKAKFKVGDLIGLPVRRRDGMGWDGNGGRKIALVIEVVEWRRPALPHEEEAPITWDYTVITADKQEEIQFNHQHFLCFAAKLLEAA